jgi:hypothetical protein
MMNSSGAPTPNIPPSTVYYNASGQSIGGGSSNNGNYGSGPQTSSAHYSTGGGGNRNSSGGTAYANYTNASADDEQLSQLVSHFVKNMPAQQKLAHDIVSRTDRTAKEKMYEISSIMKQAGMR